MDTETDTKKLDTRRQIRKEKASVTRCKVFKYRVEETSKEQRNEGRKKERRKKGKIERKKERKEK